MPNAPKKTRPPADTAADSALAEAALHGSVKSIVRSVVKFSPEPADASLQAENKAIASDFLTAIKEPGSRRPMPLAGEKQEWSITRNAPSRQRP